MTPEEKRASIQALRARIGQIKPFATKRQSFTKKQRQAVFDAYEGLCAGCDDKLKSGWQVDHRKEIAEGGLHAPSNWQPLCGREQNGCHAAKTAAYQTRKAKADRIREREENGPTPSRIQSAGFRQDITKRMDGSVVARRKPA